MKERYPTGPADDKATSTKKSAYLSPPSNAAMKDIPMTAANVYDQVRGTLSTGMQKKKIPEPILNMADPMKEIQ